jgi:hypothetical protein
MMTIPQIHPGKTDRPDRRLSTGHEAGHGGVRPKHGTAPRDSAKSRPRDEKIPAQLCRSAARTRRNQLAPPRPSPVRPQPTVKSP